MNPQQALTTFPDRGTIQRVADGKQAMPADPLLASVYEVQIAKLRKEEAARKPDADGNFPPELSDAEKAAAKLEEHRPRRRAWWASCWRRRRDSAWRRSSAMPVEDLHCADE